MEHAFSIYQTKLYRKNHYPVTSMDILLSGLITYQKLVHNRSKKTDEAHKLYINSSFLKCRNRKKIYGELLSNPLAATFHLNFHIVENNSFKRFVLKRRELAKSNFHAYK